MKKKKRKRETNNFDEYVITPYMKRIDEELIKINQKLLEIRAELKQLERLYNRIDTWINAIYEKWVIVDTRTKFLVNIHSNGLRYKIKAMINKLFRRG